MTTAYSTVKAKLIEAIDDFSLLEGCHKILVSFSGGADSSLLLSLLSSYKDLTVEAAHFNHCLRGKESERDERFCVEFCAERSIPLHIGSAPEGVIASAKGESTEEAARRYRYDFLLRLDAEHHYDAIAMAHNADDNLETLLFRLVRGATLEGLCAIPPKRDKFIRPLILCSSTDIRAACHEEGVPFIVDSSNTDTTYTRNYLRHEVIPQLKELNPSLADTIASTLRSLANDRDFVASAASPISFRDGRAKLVSLPNALLHRVIRAEALSFGTSLESKHVMTAAKLLRSARSYLTYAVPGGIFLCDRDEVSFVKNIPQPTTYEIPLHYGYHRIDDESAVYLLKNGNGCEKILGKLKNIYKLSIQASFSSATMEGNVILRNRRAGDTYYLQGMTRKVKKLLQNTPFSRKRRDTLPFLVKDDKILWIPSFPPADTANADRKGGTINDYILLYVAEPRHGKDPYELSN